MGIYSGCYQKAFWELDCIVFEPIQVGTVFGSDQKSAQGYLQLIEICNDDNMMKSLISEIQSKAQ